MPSPAPRASRRTVLASSAAAGAALLAGTATGCGVLQGDETTDAAAVEPTVDAVDADSDLVETVAAQITTALALAGATGSSFDRLRPLSRRLVSLHRSHLGELGRPDDDRGGVVNGSLATARARLLRSEEKLQQQLVRAALEAESGALAQVFASMAAAIAQERTVAR